MRALLAALALLLLASHARAQPGRTLAVIVAPDRAGEPLDAAELALIYRRKRLHWQDGARIEPVNLPADDLARRAFSRAVLGGEPAQLQDYWNGLYFHGISPPFVVASEAAVIAFVAATPNAIGYVPLCGVDARVRVLLVVDAGGSVRGLDGADPATFVASVCSH